MENDKKDQGPTQPRRVYVAPRVEESAPFEHLILSCMHSTILECDSDDGVSPPPLRS